MIFIIIKFREKKNHSPQKKGEWYIGEIEMF